jgi:hypothetical protein
VRLFLPIGWPDDGQGDILGTSDRGTTDGGDPRAAAKVAPAKAFDTLGQAAKYVSEGPDFANVQRMLMSLEITN